MVHTLVRALEKNKISHSYIFAGPEGTQKETVAYCFAKALLSQEKPFEKTESKKIEDHNHPDLIDLFPQGVSIKIDQIREIKKDISVKPFASNYKIYILHQAHTMGAPAQNSFLKTLEEPPEYAVIILITNSLSALLPTIRSRSQILQFQPIHRALLEKYLLEKHGLSQNKAWEISLIANGNIKRALELVNDHGILQERKEILKKLLKIIKGDIALIFPTALWLKEKKDYLEEWLDFFMIWFRDVALYQELGDNPYIIHREYKDWLEEFSFYLSYDQIHDIIKEIQQSKNDIKHNINLQLNMESMLLKMQNREDS
ncbi:DNA polymerase-3 subunit delta' [Garciella nitratireducens DSM 15102]|uniref:DNA polymerase III subunit delta' n=1 Tax=Garciella nitratireducens DSM 15102 TaxID=1121911 RepID=A0A1T4P746_9FIRM|nr:DNA polymerase III delta prime subunit [Garciella nitratireducens]SJZ87324.1 DNA polymerase-3 subunit delta' [Garciella nitratireducens DSM 15102]